MARDLGEVLGCGGTLASLKRTRIGPMRLEDALDVPHDGLDRTGILNALIPPERMPLAPPPYRLTDPELARKFTLGAAVPGNGEAGADGLLSVLNPSGMLLGVAEGRSGLLHPRVVLNRD
jgi:tRNA pseudouridine55 synthase